MGADADVLEQDLGRRGYYRVRIEVHGIGAAAAGSFGAVRAGRARDEGAAVGEAGALVGEALGVCCGVVAVGATTVGGVETGVGVLFLFLPPHATSSSRTSGMARKAACFIRPA